MFNKVHNWWTKFISFSSIFDKKANINKLFKKINIYSN